MQLMSTKLTHLQYKMDMQALHEGQQAPREITGHSKGWLICNSSFFWSFIFFHNPDLPPVFSILLHHIPVSASPSALALSSETTVLPNPAHHHAHHLPSSSPQRPLGRATHSEMLLRVMISSTLKSLLRYDKHFCAKTNWNVPGKPKNCCSLPSGYKGRKVRSQKQDKVSSEEKMGLLGTTQKLLLPGNTTRERGAQAAVSAGQVPGPCRDDCRCNNSIFISGVTPPISYSNYH